MFVNNEHTPPRSWIELYLPPLSFPTIFPLIYLSPLSIFLQNLPPLSSLTILLHYLPPLSSTVFPFIPPLSSSPVFLAIFPHYLPATSRYLIKGISTSLPISTGSLWCSHWAPVISWCSMEEKKIMNLLSIELDMLSWSSEPVVTISNQVSYHIPESHVLWYDPASHLSRHIPVSQVWYHVPASQLSCHIPKSQLSCPRRLDVMSCPGKPVIMSHSKRPEIVSCPREPGAVSRPKQPGIVSRLIKLDTIPRKTQTVSFIIFFVNHWACVVLYTCI